jgi:hypothetical protein
MVDQLHLDWELAFRELLAPLDVDRTACHLDIVDSRDKRLRASHSASPLPSSFTTPSVESAGEREQVD